MLEEDIINLNEEQFIAAGAFCKCYQHPTDLQKCVKVPTSNKKALKRHHADLKYYRKLHHDQINLRYIADYLGQCETPLGTGYIYQCVRDHNGDVSQTLDSYLKQPDANLGEVYPLLHELGLYLVKNKILISDLHARNILIQKDDQGNMTSIIVDGIGDRVAITVLNVFPKLVTSKIIRRWNRFARKELNSNASISQ